mgnify:CR=1 FL=1
MPTFSFIGSQGPSVGFNAFHGGLGRHEERIGISAKFGDRFFVRPGLGIAVHTGSAANFEDPDNGKIDFGSRVLFEPELGIGARINDRMTIEASWVHMSTAQLFGKQNPGIDTVGLRVNFAF